MTSAFLFSSQSANIRQSGGLPAVMKQAMEPESSKASAYEGMEGGMAIANVVILTALEAEHKAIEAHLEPFGNATRLQEQIHPTSRTIYTQGQFKTANGIWHVSIVQIDMGNASAAVETTRAIEYLKPRVILFVGVAGGIKDVNIGDVVAAPIVYSYDCGKTLDDRTLPRPKLGEADYDLRQRAQAEARNDNWRSRIRPGLSTTDRIPSVYLKPIAAGEKVIASRKAPIYKFLREYYDDAVAVEMEGFGFLKATQQVKTVSAMVIRGISDLLDDKNDQLIEPELIRQERAARNASAFAFTLLEKLDGEVSAEQTEAYEATAQVLLDSTLPQGVVSLNVQALSADEQYYIHAHHGKWSFVEQGKIDKSLLALHQRIGSNLAADSLLGEIDTCNMAMQRAENCLAGKLLARLHDWSEVAPDQVKYVVIDDRTDTEIPWELLEAGESPIGVTFQTVRYRQTSLETTPENTCCGGGILVYANAAYGGWQQYQRQEFSMFPEFLNQMQKPTLEFGLVFIDGYSFEAPLQSSPTAYIKRSKLFKNRASIVFISGHVDLDVSIGVTHQMLLTNFLDYGAKGVVGVSRPIDRLRARTVVDQFSEVHRQNPDCTVPEILRQLRSNAWEALDNEVNEDTCAIYLATFSHIYYGDPLTVLRLIPQDDP
jgi:nucleoside phosphorylase